jgi:hypothetical protein
MAKQKHVLVVFSNPTTQEQEDEYNSWYTDQHLGEVLAVPGLVAAQRFKLQGPSTTLPGRYLALYEVEHNDPPTVLEALAKSAGTGEMFISPAIDVASTVTSFYTPITQRVAKKATGKKAPAKKVAKKSAKKAAKKAPKKAAKKTKRR